MSWNRYRSYNVSLDVLHAKYCSKGFLCVMLFNPRNNPSEKVDAITIVIFYSSKLRLNDLPKVK